MNEFENGQRNLPFDCNVEDARLNPRITAGLKERLLLQVAIFSYYQLSIKYLPTAKMLFKAAK